ncbi:hypothetical protein H2200_001513 [Cladophialophora chaetospira]|uniref:Catalase n=1 Tax=Cladophialophora chaetospira TaxID=386627 RepID=A0AA38XL54_9EURO|nr:hypothetical protein H2200_001513 [Cladophialophora chaetospira]
MSSKHYIYYDDPSVEPTVPGEESLINEIITTINKVQQHNFSLHRHGFRGTHVKTQGIVKGELTILPDLPSELAQGICSPENASSNNGKKPIILRFANEPSFLQDDRAPGPRGCGLKMFNVEGMFLDAQGSKTHTQDMTFNNAPVLELTNLPTAVQIFKVRERNFRTPEKIEQEVKKRDDAELQMAPTQLPNHHFLAYTMYSQSAYRWGLYVVKYALFPTGETQRRLSEKSMEEGSDPEQHSIWLQDFFSHNDATYDLRVQLCENLQDQPVESCAEEWDEEKYPFQTVARVVFPQGQDCFDAKRRTFWEERMGLNVWYGLDEHRPLGSANRLRKRLYQESQRFRRKLNAEGELVEVSSIDQIP